jgi:transposase
MWEQIYSIYKTFGRGAAERALTPPRKFVERICARTGADVEEALRQRKQAVTEILEFLESLTDADFEDLD